ncbi:MAG: M23 family metallopeptidase [Nanoarchaeota archaeon]
MGRTLTRSKPRRIAGKSLDAAKGITKAVKTAWQHTNDFSLTQSINNRLVLPAWVYGTQFITAYLADRGLEPLTDKAIDAITQDHSALEFMLDKGETALVYLLVPPIAAELAHTVSRHRQNKKSATLPDHTPEPPEVDPEVSGMEKAGEYLKFIAAWLNGKRKNTELYLKAATRNKYVGAMLAGIGTMAGAMIIPEWLDSPQYVEWAARLGLASVSVPTARAVYQHLQDEERGGSVLESQARYQRGKPLNRTALTTLAGILATAYGAGSHLADVSMQYYCDGITRAGERLHSEWKTDIRKLSLDDLITMHRYEVGKDTTDEEISTETFEEYGKQFGIEAVVRIQRQLGRFNELHESAFAKYHDPLGISPERAAQLIEAAKGAYTQESGWQHVWLKGDSLSVVTSPDSAASATQVTPQAEEWANYSLGREFPELQDTLWKKIGEDKRGNPKYIGVREAPDSLGFSWQKVKNIPKENFDSSAYITRNILDKYIRLMLDDDILPGLEKEHGWMSDLYKRHLGEVVNTMSDDEFRCLNDFLWASYNMGYRKLIGYSKKAKTREFDEYIKQAPRKSRPWTETRPYVKKMREFRMLYKFQPIGPNDLIQTQGWSFDPETGTEHYRNVVNLAPETFGIPGDEINAPFPGKVIKAVDKQPPEDASDQEKRLYSLNGNYMIIEHTDEKNLDNKVWTYYLHLEDIVVKDGMVETGQPIATMGHSGDSEGVTLGFGIKGKDGWYDPLMVFPDMGKDQIHYAITLKDKDQQKTVLVDRTFVDYAKTIGLWQGIKAYVHHKAKDIVEGYFRNQYVQRSKKDIDFRPRDFTPFTQNLWNLANSEADLTKKIESLETLSDFLGGSALDDVFHKLQLAYIDDHDWDKAYHAALAGLALGERYQREERIPAFYDKRDDINESLGDVEHGIFHDLRSEAGIGRIKVAEALQDELRKKFPQSTMIDDAGYLIASLQEPDAALKTIAEVDSISAHNYRMSQQQGKPDSRHRDRNEDLKKLLHQYQRRKA